MPSVMSGLTAAPSPSSPTSGHESYWRWASWTACFRSPEVRNGSKTYVFPTPSAPPAGDFSSTPKPLNRH
ncbi:CRISPR-associated protein Cas5 [Aeromonas hydrophila]|uniref:CRISPR-associated protein Cas5 n=1 Tax=Aeromonas hydrophila TaxID=644 RepID=UPI0036DF8DCD